MLRGLHVSLGAARDAAADHQLALLRVRPPRPAAFARSWMDGRQPAAAAGLAPAGAGPAGARLAESEARRLSRNGKRMLADDAAPVDRPPRRLAACAGAGAGTPRLVFCEAARPRR